MMCGKLSRNHLKRVRQFDYYLTVQTTANLHQVIEMHYQASDEAIVAKKFL